MKYFRKKNVFKNKLTRVYTAKISPNVAAIVVMKQFQNTLSGSALMYGLVCDMILGMDTKKKHTQKKKKKKKKKKKRNDKILGLVGVLSGTSMLHKGYRQSRAKVGFQTR